MLYKMRYRLVSHGDVKLQSTGHSYSTRSKEYSYTQPTAQVSLLPKTITEWNQLPRETALLNSLTAFKNAILNIY